MNANREASVGTVVEEAKEIGEAPDAVMAVANESTEAIFWNGHSII